MPYTTFITNLDNALQLVTIARGIADPNSQQLLYRSAVVLSVAHWQNFNEELLKKYSKLINDYSKSSNNLPDIVRQEIGSWIYLNHGIDKDPLKSKKLIWEFASGLWKRYYQVFAQEKTGQLNTPNSKNLIAVYTSILGIKNINVHWVNQITVYNPVQALDQILIRRHEIAHGRSFVANLAESDIIGYIDVLKEIARVTYSIAESETSNVLAQCGTLYTLDSYDSSGLIKWLAALPEPRFFSVSQLRTIDAAWYANHKKLSHSSWNLLSGRNTHRTTTDSFTRFIAGEIAIPYEIVSFNGVDSIAKPGTPMVYFRDL